MLNDTNVIPNGEKRSDESVDKSLNNEITQSLMLLKMTNVRCCSLKLQT
jgi:hypothetical protein